VSHVEDLVEIRRIVDIYSFSIDAVDKARFVTLFDTDATVTVPGRGTFTGPAEIVRILEHFEEGRYLETMHSVSSAMADVDGDQATGQVYGTARHRHLRDGKEFDRIAMLHYHDQYVRTPDGWKFRSRNLNVKWNDLVAVVT
jgi:hypothetical protein